MTPAPVYRVHNLIHRRGQGAAAFELRVPSFVVRPGERLALVGPSGCGKSTLLDVLALVLRPHRVDRFFIGGGDAGVTDLVRLLRGRRHGAMASLRGRTLGYVLQTGGLLPFLTVGDNIALPCRLLGMPSAAAVARVATRLGIERHLGKKPADLSVGERQRVAVARALVHAPPVVLADEPTAALDPDTADTVMSLFIEAAEAQGATVILASHDHERVGRFGLTRVSPVLAREGEPACVCSTFIH